MPLESISQTGIQYSDIIQFREGKSDVRDDFVVTRLTKVPFFLEKSSFSCKVKPQQKKRPKKKKALHSDTINQQMLTKAIW